MSRRARPAVLGLVAAMSCSYALYPAYLAVAGRRRARRGGEQVQAGEGRSPAEQFPPVTVVVPAYREAGVIAAKVADLLDNGYPGELEILVVADDPPTAAAARAAGARVLETGTRRGKAQALNAGMGAVKTPLAVLTDANNRLRAGSIARLARHLDDPAVGAAAGEKTEADSGGEELYWRFESWLKQGEWRLGTTIGLVGELAALRSDLWRPIPDDVATDDLWVALDLSERGYRIAYEPLAVAVDPPVRSMAARWERRTRSVSGALHIFWRRRHQLGPWGGLVAAEVWGHRLARYTVAPLAHVGLLLVALRRARTSPLARGFLALHALGAAVLARVALDPDAPLGKATSALSQALFLNAVALGGLWRFLRGDRRTQWAKAERDDPQGG